MSTVITIPRPRIGERMSAIPKPIKIVLWIVVAALAYLLPVIKPPLLATSGTDFGGVMFLVAVYVLVALGLNIVIGYAGLLDLGYVGFYAVGAYTAGILTTEHWSWPYLLTLPAAVAVTMVSGVLLGAPTLRVRGDYLAIVTLGFGEIIRLALNNTAWLGGSRGIKVEPPPDIGGEEGLFQVPHLFWGDGTVLIDSDEESKFLVFGVLDAVPYYWLALTVIVVILFADRLIKDSRVGRAWEATREDEDAAELMGVPTFKFKLLAFAMGAFIGGLAGWLFAGYQGFINPASFDILLSILFVAAVVVGGQGNRWGAIVGAALVAYLPLRFLGFEDWRILVFGLALMLLAIYRPQGMLPPRRTVRARQLEHELEELEEGTDIAEEPHRD